MTLRYRPNVAAIVQNSGGQILVCERIDIPGAWQFPQGGMEPDETPEQALAREVREELSLEPGDYKVLGRKGKYRYLLGDGKTKKGYHGQEQEYFLLQLVSPETCINLETSDQEFTTSKWIAPHEFDLRWLPVMKREVYRQVLGDFFNVKFVNEGN